MASVKKLVGKILDGVSELRQEEVEKILNHFGYYLTNVTGDHFVYRKDDDPDLFILLPIKHKKVHKHYLRKLRDFLELEVWYASQ